MEADTQAQVAFFLTGRRPDEFLDPVEGLQLRPALFAGYEDLTPLRYDFPLVLDGKACGPTQVEALSSIFDQALAKAAQGADAERIRKHGLRIEREIRVLAAEGVAGTLSVLWERAAARLTAQGDETFADSNKRLRAAVKCDGQLADCDAQLPRRLMRHVWDAAQQSKSAHFRARLQRLVLKLSGILQADVERSARGVTAERMQATVGSGFASAFDFDAMSTLLLKSQPHDTMPAGAPAAHQRAAARAQVAALLRGRKREGRGGEGLQLRLRQLRRRLEGLA